MTTVYVTAPPENAEELTEALLEEELAACVNRFECRSTYRWEGKIVREDEVVLLVKTTPERYGEVETRIEELHPSDVPCIERFEETGALSSFAAWIDESVR